MRRAGNLWPEVVSYGSLERATLRAARGKQGRAPVVRFLADRERWILRLEQDLEADLWRPARPREFLIHDPKERLISAPPFPDRVVHQALIGALEPIFDRRMLPESFACRRGKGTHRALDFAQRLLRRHAFALKLDVARCFASFPHRVLLETLERTLKDRRVLRLGAHIIAGPDSTAPGEGRGLPIGALTSQWFANLVLDRLDHHVKEHLAVPGYVRYMDDFLCFADSKEALRAAHRGIQEFLGQELGLELKARATRLAPTQSGMPFLGWTLYPGLRRIRRQSLDLLCRRLARSAFDARQGRRSSASHRAAVAAVCQHLAHGDSLGLRRRTLLPWIDSIRAPPELD